VVSGERRKIASFFKKKHVRVLFSRLSIFYWQFFLKHYQIVESALDNNQNNQQPPFHFYFHECQS